MATPYQPRDMAAIWSGVARNYDFDKYWEGPENRANLHHLLTHIGDPRGKRIIEVGAGSGYLSLILARQGGRCALLDISQEALQKAVDQFRTFSLEAPEIYLADALQNDLPDDCFDVAWNSGVLEHFYDEGKKKLITEMLRITKPGGKVIIMVPNADCWQFQLVQRWQKFTGKWEYGFEDDLSPARLRSLCSEHDASQINAYAFNPILGWRWVPVIKKLVRLLGFDRELLHIRTSGTGFVSVLVAIKE
jgi:ubiquinone/menaquinone biosynthesis C-methylase UbiE